MASKNLSLVASSASKKKTPAKKHANSAWTNYKTAVINLHDLKEALESITSYITAVWRRENSKEYQTNELKRDDLAEEYDASIKEKKRLVTKLAKTDRRISSAQVHSDKTDDGKLKWNIKDVCLVSVTLFGAVLAVGLGAANVYANLMGAELPIFIQAPWLAITLSMLLPVGSLAIKFISTFFRYEESRRLFALVLYLLTTVLVLVWSYLFAQSFASVTGGGIDIEALLSGSSGSHGTMLVWVQLLVELLAGSCLFVAAESISIKYHPRYYCDNPEYMDTQRTLDNHEPKHIALRDELAQLNGALTAMDADLDALINEHIADFLAYRERVVAANTFN